MHEIRFPPVFPHSTKWTTSKFLCLYVVSFHPQHLESWVIVGLKLKAFQNFIKLLQIKVLFQNQIIFLVLTLNIPL